MNFAVLITGAYIGLFHKLNLSHVINGVELRIWLKILVMNNLNFGTSIVDPRLSVGLLSGYNWCNSSRDTETDSCNQSRRHMCCHIPFDKGFQHLEWL